jgi:metal-dependent hydrolase (beta-lactamase superfamily II)
VLDDQALDDQALVAHVRDSVLVVGTGCGHAVVVNTCRHAIRLTGSPHRLGGKGGSRWRIM